MHNYRLLTLFAPLAIAIYDPSTPVVAAEATGLPGNDFYRYVNGAWLADTKMPEGLASYGTSAMLARQNKQRVRDLILGASTPVKTRTSVQQKIGDFYESQSDRNQIESQGLMPIAKALAAIRAIADPRSLSSYLGSTLPLGDGGNTQAEGLLNVWFHQGFTESRHYLPHLQQGGLGLPDREDYLGMSAASVLQRAKYQAYLASVMKQLGRPNSEECAARILALETDIARSHASRADTDDVYKDNNSWARALFTTQAPGMDWGAFFSAAGLGAQQDFVVWQPSAIVGASALIVSRPIEVWKDYLIFHLIHHYANVLPQAYRDLYLAYSGVPSNGSALIESRAIEATNAALGDAVAQLYVARYFPPQAKAATTAMVENLRSALAMHIQRLTWMTPGTKHKALVKLAALTIGLGYPDHWMDYTGLAISRTDALGNNQRVEQFSFKQQLAKLRQPIDPGEWSIDPQSVSALINFSPNAEQFSAGLLQPPYFDYQGDAASNYGSAGAGIAHEMIHSFDELGNLYDAEGRLKRWWNSEDLAAYRAVTAPLVAQCSAYCPLPDLCVRGEQVLSESSADLVGLEVAHDAYIRSFSGKPDVEQNGFSGEQRFFLAFAQRWRKIQTETDIRHQIETDIHLPAEYRSNAVRNVEAWYRAYHVGPEDKLYVERDRRPIVW